MRHPQAQRPLPPSPQRRHVIVPGQEVGQQVKHVARHIQRRDIKKPVRDAGGDHHVDHRIFAHEEPPAGIGRAIRAGAEVDPDPRRGHVGQGAVHQAQRRVQHLDLQIHVAVAHRRHQRIGQTGPGRNLGHPARHAHRRPVAIAHRRGPRQVHLAAIGERRQHRAHRLGGQDARAQLDLGAADQPRRHAVAAQRLHHRLLFRPVVGQPADPRLIAIHHHPPFRQVRHRLDQRQHIRAPALGDLAAGQFHIRRPAKLGHQAHQRVPAFDRGRIAHRLHRAALVAAGQQRVGIGHRVFRPGQPVEQPRKDRHQPQGQESRKADCRHPHPAARSAASRLGLRGRGRRLGRRLCHGFRRRPRRDHRAVLIVHHRGRGAARGHDLLQHGLGSLQPLFAVGHRHLVDQPAQRLRHAAGVQHLALALHHLHRVAADVRFLAPEGRQQQRAQRIDIRPRVGLPAQLFGGGIGILAREFVAHDGLGARVGVLGDAEVDDHRIGGAAVAQDDIVGRQVAVHDVLGMGRHQALGHPPRDDHQIRRRHAAFLHLLLERRPLDIIHHQIDMAVIGALVVVIAHHRVMADLAHVLLARHQRQEILVAGIFRAQRLQRHHPAGNLGPGAIDLGRAAPAQHLLDAVGVVEHLPDLEDPALVGPAHAVTPAPSVPATLS